MKHDFLGVCIGCAFIYTALWAFEKACEAIGIWLTLAIIVLVLQALTELARRKII